MTESTIPTIIRNALPDRKQLQRRRERLLKTTLKLVKDPITLFALALITGFLLLAVLAPIIAPPEAYSNENAYQIPRDFSSSYLSPLTDGHLFGTNSNGGDIFYGVVWGSRISIAISLAVVIPTTIAGVIIGGIAGYAGGWIDEVLMRFTDAMISLPSLLWSIAVVAALGPSLVNIVIAISTITWSSYARLMRGEVLHVKNESYVDAARVNGSGHVSIFTKEILPNAVTPIIVLSTLNMGRVVLTAASISFIGLAPPGIAEWGRIISMGQTGLISGFWWISIIPGVAIFLWGFGWNLLGDGLRDVLDPRADV